MTIITLDDSNGMEHTNPCALPALMCGTCRFALMREGRFGYYHSPQPASLRLIKDLEHCCDDL